MMFAADVKLSENGAEGVVLSDALSEIGYSKGASLLVDKSVTHLSDLRDGDVVVLRSKIEEKEFVLLRQYIRPGLLITNSKSKNLANLFDEFDVGVEIIGSAILVPHSSNVIWYG